MIRPDLETLMTPLKHATRWKNDRVAGAAGGRLSPPGLHTVATRDPDVVREWAARQRAEPATGEATASGPSVMHINDGGAGIRFNFPGFAPFRQISWEEWFEHFELHDLAFVFEEEDATQIAARAYELWSARAGGHGYDRDDWFEAQRDLRQRRVDPASTGLRYRLVKTGTVT